MTINDLKTNTPYIVTNSLYQFKEGDVVFMPNENTIVVQGDGALRLVELVDERMGLAVSGTNGGFLHLNEAADDTGVDRVPGGIDTREFLLRYDETRFEPAENLVCQKTDDSVRVIPNI